MCEEYDEEAMQAFWTYLAERERAKRASLDEETITPIVLGSLPTLEPTRAKPRPVAR
ncbi:MAG: hypothetical protein ACT4OI_01480 [Methanobacteriota archaeon]